MDHPSIWRQHIRIRLIVLLILSIHEVASLSSWVTLEIIASWKMGTCHDCASAYSSRTVQQYSIESISSGAPHDMRKHRGRASSGRVVHLSFNLSAGLHGSKVVIMGRREKFLAEAVGRLRRDGVEASFISGDVRCEDVLQIPEAHSRLPQFPKTMVNFYQKKLFPDPGKGAQSSTPGQECTVAVD